MASSLSSSRLPLLLLVLLLLLLPHPPVTCQQQVSYSVINIRLTHLCGDGQQEEGGEQQERVEGTAGWVSRTLRFLESLRAAQSAGVQQESTAQESEVRTTQDGDREDPGGHSPPAADTSRTPTAARGVPAFLRAVRRGHMMSDLSSQDTAFWNITAVKGQEDVVHEGEHSFNLQFLHALHHRYVEVVFSPTNHHSNESQQVCSFTFCDEQKTVCATLNGDIRSNGSLYHTVPTRFIFGTVISSFPRSIVKLVGVTCGQTKIQMAGNDQRPLLAFFQTKQLADTVNTFALAGWQRLDDPQEDVGNIGERKRRSTQSSMAASGKGKPQLNHLTDTLCRRHTWTVTAQDLGLEGVMLEPDGGMEIGYCQGDCRWGDKPPATSHAILRVKYLKAGGYMAGNVIQEPHCVPTRLLPHSAVLLTNPDRYDMRTFPTIRVTQCECR